GLITPEGEEEDDDALMLEPYDPVGDDPRADELYADEDESRVVIPAPAAMLGASFLVCALLLAGMPPLSGFLAKFAMLGPMLDGPSQVGTTALFTVVIASGFCTVIALCRAGIQIFWAEPDRHFPHARVTEISAIVLLLGLCLLLTVVVQAPMDYLHDAARQLHDASNYVHGVLPAHGAAP